MKFEELKSNLKQEIFTGYILEGIDEYLLSTSYDLIVKYSNIEFADLNIIKFTEGVIDCADVVRALDTMPVFSNKKMVYLDLRMSKKSELKNVKILNDYLSNPNPYAILVVNLGANEDDFGIGRKNISYVDCSRLDLKIVEAKINAILKSRDKAIVPSAAKLLMEYCLGDLAKIIVECEKLIAYVGDRGQISERDIEEIVTRSLEYRVFELTEALAKKNSSVVYSILDDLKSKKDEYKMLPALIYSHFRRLFHIALNQGSTNAEIARLLGVKEYAIKMSQTQIKLFTKSSLKKINEMCAQLDFDLKQSNISVENSVDLLILFILNI